MVGYGDIHDVREYHIPCEVCGKWTLYMGTRRCNNCWEVERRLEDYLRTTKGRDFVMQQLAKHLTPIAERDHVAMEALRAASKEGFQIRLSNKAGLGYWWAYYDSQVCQANDPAEAILGIYKTLDVTVKDEQSTPDSPRLG